MEDEKDIQSPGDPDGTPSGINKEPEQPAMNADAPSSEPPADASVPLYEEFHAVPAPKKTASETALCYAEYLHNAPGFPWKQEQALLDPTPSFEAPYITGASADRLTDSELISGIFLNIPRSPRLWVGDQLKLRWGHNTFYTTIGESKGRNGPRLIQYLNNESLADYDNGLVEVRYEVVRRSRLVGISETLTINLHREGERRRRSVNRTRAIRRRRAPR